MPSWHSISSRFENAVSESLHFQANAPGLTPGRVREFQYTYGRGRPTPPKAAESGKGIVVV
jgi:hypothetical protein